MTRWFVLFFVFLAQSVYGQSHQDLVAKAQRDLKAAGIDITGDCGAFKVTNLAVVYIRAAGDPQAGILAKSAGSGCAAYGGQLYAKDASVYPNGDVFDTLIGSGAMGGNGGPAWNQSDRRSDVACPCPPGLWRNPIDPSLYGFRQVSTPPTPTPPTTQPNQPVDLTPISAWIQQWAQWVNANDEQRYQDIKAEFRANAARQVDLGAQLKAHDDKPDKLDRLFDLLTDRATIASIIAGLATWRVTK